MEAVMKLQTALRGCKLVNAQAEPNTVLVVTGEYNKYSITFWQKYYNITMILFVSLPWFYRQVMEQVGEPYDMKWKG